MTIHVMHDSTIQVHSLIEAFEPLLDAFKDERAFYFEACVDTAGVVPIEQDRKSLADMDAIIERAEATIKRARGVV